MLSSAVAVGGPWPCPCTSHMRSLSLAVAGLMARRSCAISSAVCRSSFVCTPCEGRIVIGGRAPGGSGRNAVAPAEELERTITSVAESLERRAPIALANVSRSVEPPAGGVATWDGQEAPARVEMLPLVP